jgi:thiamine biosynthesis lipoprotein ApbE
MMAAVALPSATETDALSTALLVGGEAEFDRVTALRPAMRALMISEHSDAAGKLRVLSRGIPARQD